MEGFFKDFWHMGGGGTYHHTYVAVSFSVVLQKYSPGTPAEYQDTYLKNYIIR